MVRFEGVTKRYGDKTALDQLDLDIRDGEIFGLIGHNGAGKSTTIKCLTSVIAPSRRRKRPAYCLSTMWSGKSPAR